MKKNSTGKEEKKTHRGKRERRRKEGDRKNIDIDKNETRRSVLGDWGGDQARRTRRRD